MLRQTAYTILTKYITNPVLLYHSLAVEITMRAFAPHFNGDVEEWGIVGLLHDADYEKANGHPQKHGLLLSDMEPNAVPTSILHAIATHNFTQTHMLPQSPMEWTLVCCDELTGVISQIAQQPSKKITTLTPAAIVQEMQKKEFPKNVTATIGLCEKHLGISLTEFVAITLSAMQQITENTNTS